MGAELDAVAGRILNVRLSELRQERYEALLRLLDDPESTVERDEDGREYEVTAEAVWDDSDQRNLRVWVMIAGYRLRRRFNPLSGSFILSPDGRFVGV